MPRPSLRERATEPQTGTEVAKPSGPTLRQQITRMEREFAAAMPRGVEASQLVRDALTCLSKTPQLAECQADTVLGGLMTCAQLGLRPGVLGQAWLLPFWDKRSGTRKAQLIIGYQGLVELAYRSDKVASVVARAVYEGERIEVEYGLEERLHHVPTLDGPRGRPRGYYAVVKLINGGRAYWWMSQADMEAWRDQHAMARDKAGNVVGPWVDDFEAMALKTVFLRLAKWMPKSTELASAMAADESVRWSTDPGADVAVASVPVREIEGTVVSPDGGERPGGDGAETGEAPTEAQQRKLHALLRSSGAGDRDAGLALMGEVLGREVSSSSVLTRAEVGRVIDYLESPGWPSDDEADQ